MSSSSSSSSSSASSSSPSPLTLLSSNQCHGGVVCKFSHLSSSTQTVMKFNVFLPPQCFAAAAASSPSLSPLSIIRSLFPSPSSSSSSPSSPSPSLSSLLSVPSLYFLSGLTCTEDNFFHKACALLPCAVAGLALIGPDTSPRGHAEEEGERAHWSAGVGASYYVNAKRGGLRDHYRMFDYVVKELPETVEKALPLNGKRGISGHSMGGHGAIVCFLRTVLSSPSPPFSSCSAFCPISHPSHPACEWGQRAFSLFFGEENKQEWAEWDATEIIKANSKQIKEKRGDIAIKVDQGTADEFLTVNLRTGDLIEAAREERERGGGVRIEYGEREGYDHSYYFVQTFIEQHIQWHAERLK